MPNVTTAIPPRLSGDTATDLVRLREWGVALVDELNYLLSHLDVGNVMEAASVKAENIDTNTARIENAQIGDLSADKLKAGTINSNLVKVQSGNGCLHLEGSRIAISDGEHVRFLAALDPKTYDFDFLLCNKDGIPTTSLDSDGNAVFSGQVESSTVYASTIIGTDSESYINETGGVFAELNTTGLKIMHDTAKRRLQKLGMSVGDDGTAYMVLGAGNGEDTRVINGVVYTNGAFKIEKNDAGAMLGLVGYEPQIFLWEDNGELWISGSRVRINGVDVLAELQALSNRIDQISIQGGETNE
ncbi:MAG: hypothetical protein IKW60_01115 [Clostridia bacterium]|nr:hypothetical protein [Clostridia bacterium]